MPIDPTTPIGKVRLRIGDFGDLPLLSDSVIQSALDDKGGDIPKASALAANYILAFISRKTHQRMTAALEVWGAEHFDNYLRFLKATILNPAVMDMSMVVHSGSTASTEDDPLVLFQKNWNESYGNTPGSLYAGA